LLSLASGGAFVASLGSLFALVGCSSEPLGKPAVATSTGTAASAAPAGSALPGPRPQTAPSAPWTARKSTRAAVQTGRTLGTSTASGALADGVIVKFKPSVSKSVDHLLVQRRSFVQGTTDHSASLDAIVQHQNISQARAFLPWRSGLDTVAAQAQQNARFSLTRRASRGAAAPASDLTNVYQLTVSGDVDAAVAELRQDPHVAWAQPNYIVHVTAYTPNDPYFSSSGSFGQPYADLWGLHSISTEAAWDTARGQGVVVAVVDTGVDRTHPDIAANIWQNPHEVQNGIDDDGNGLIDDTWGWDYAYGDNNPIDHYGHGTHVAGTIAADDNNGIGIVGIAPDAKIMVLKGLNDSGSGSTFNLSQALLYAAEQGADVINNSWGCDGCGPDPVQDDAIAQAHSLGAVVVFASGNSNNDVLYSSNNVPSAILVGANDPAGARAFFSNFGLIDVVAPGGGYSTGNPAVDPFRAILSLKSSVCSADACPPALIVGQNYVRQAGTSMAAPHVAGLAALILSQHPTYTPEQVRQVIRRSSDDLNGNGLDSDLGYGRVNAQRAMAEPTPLEVLISGPFGTTDATSLAITGSARGDSFGSWTLDYGSGGWPTSWTTLAQSTAQMTSATLTTWNAGALADGSYTLRLRASMTNGRNYEDRQTLVFDRITLAGPDDRHVYRGGDTVQVTGTVAPAGLNHFQVAVETVDGAAVPGAQVTLTGGGTSPVHNGVLATWNTAGIAANTYRLRLRIFFDDGTEQDETTRVIVDPLLHAGWPRQLAPAGFLGVYDVTTVADVNGDGRAELVLGYGPTVQLLQHDGSELPGWPQSVDVHGGGSLSQFSPAVGDVTGDGKPEVVASNVNNEILVWNAQGSLLSGWPKAVGTGTRNRIALADIDGNGVKDIVAADDVGSVKVFRADGTLLPGFPVVAGSGIQANPTVADLDHDGKPEIISLVEGASLTVISNTGAIKPGWPKAGTFYFKGVGDLDGDGTLEIVAAGLHQVTAFHQDGTLVTGWPKDLGDSYASSLTVTDFNNDGLAEIFSGTNNQVGTITDGINAWTGTGASLPGWPFVANAGACCAGYQGLMLADVDGDGQVDIIGTHDDSEAGTLSVFRANGTLNTTLSRPVPAPGPGSESMPAVADLDGDGLLELVSIDGFGQMFVWDLPGTANARRPWPMFQQNPEHTGAPSTTGVHLPARIEAESYVRFHDSDAVDQGASGSPQCNRGDGVDSEATTDNNGRCNIGWTQPGEWLEYDVSVSTSASFDIVLRMGSGTNGRQLRVLVDGVAQGTLSAANVGWSSFGDRKISSVPMTAGNHVLRIEFVTADVNLNYLDIRLHQPIVLPARVEAENYARFNELTAANNGALAGDVQCDQGNSLDLWHTTDNNGACNIGWTQAGEWLEYDVQATQAGTFEYVLRAASGLGGKSLSLWLDGVKQGSFVINNSGWDSYQDYGAALSLSQGNHVLRVTFDTGDTNLNYINLVPVLTSPTRVQDSGYSRFYDTDLTNNGAAGAPQCDKGDGEDFAANTDNGVAGCNIGWGQPGEWVQYSVRAGSAGNWHLTVRVASGSNGSTVQVSVDGALVGTFPVQNQGWQVFRDLNVTVPSSNSAGQIRDVKLLFPQGGVDLNYIDFN